MTTMGRSSILVARVQLVLSRARKIQSLEAKRLLLVVVIFLAFIYLRRDRILTLQIANPDEAELLASGRRAMQSLVPYDRFTSPTYGPVWALLLGLLGRAGIPLSLPLAHLLSALIAATTCSIAAYVASRFMHLKTVAMILAPLIVFWGFGFNHQDYWSLSTELVPMVILLTGCAIASVGWHSQRWILVGSALVGFGSWSKYLFGLVGVAVLLVLSVQLWRCGVRLYVALLKVLVASNAITLFLYLLALLQGVSSDSLLESVRVTLDYVRGGGAGGMGDIPSVPMSGRLSALGFNLLTFLPLLPLVLHSFRDLDLKLGWPAVLKTIHTRGLGGILIMGSGLVTLCATPVIFPHYNHVLITCCLAAFLLQLPPTTNLKDSSKQQPGGPLDPAMNRLNAVALGIALLIAAPAVRGIPGMEPSIRFHQILDRDANRWERAFDKEGVPLSDFCPPGTYSFVWGWSPEVYAFYDLKPASRFVAPAGMIEGNNLNLEVGPLRAKLTQELLVEPPVCVIDAVGPSFFPGYGPEASMKEQLPFLWGRLAKGAEERVFYWDRVNPFVVLIRTDQTTRNG